jgi:hypothetical protein
MVNSGSTSNLLVELTTPAEIWGTTLKMWKDRVKGTTEVSRTRWSYLAKSQTTLPYLVALSTRSARPVATQNCTKVMVTPPHCVKVKDDDEGYGKADNEEPPTPSPITSEPPSWLSPCHLLRHQLDLGSDPSVCRHLNETTAISLHRHHQLVGHLYNTPGV